MTVLTTIDPDDFRVNEGRTRKYTGGVLGEGLLASVTSIKPIKVFRGRTPFNTDVSLDALRCAEWVADNLDRLDDLMVREHIIEAVALAPTQLLHSASGRGTRVHDAIAQGILADEADGRPTMHQDHNGEWNE